MINEPKPLSKELLRRFVAGELDDAENEAILARLAEDEASLEIVDALWQEQPSQTAVYNLQTWSQRAPSRCVARSSNKFIRPTWP